MKDDDLIFRQLDELRADDARHAPSFQRVLRGPVPAGSRKVSPAVLWGGLAGAALLAVTLWPGAGDAMPAVSIEAIEDLEASEWSAPSDALLAETATPSNSGLMREINKLLNQP